MNSPFLMRIGRQFREDLDLDEIGAVEIHRGLMAPALFAVTG